ncbi:MAG: homoserine dehydrogenase [Clostridia bacterium]|nr:homoserine dehydrogenase [Clostridia bacterium]
MKVAILGFGTVGQGVYEMLQKARDLEPGPVLVRPGKADADYKVTDISAITGAPSVGAVVEVLGGIEPARTWVEQALQAGKHVVTANKALVAQCGPELAAVAREKGVALLFSAACGGGVPFLHNLALSTRSDDILSVGGILNGTTNYMLDAMQSRGADYAEVLKDAQQLGYAEADPTADVSGLDALRKIMLACAVAFEKLPCEGLYNEGIESLTADDVRHFRGMGYTCRLVAKGGPVGDTVFAFVEPTLVPASAAECAVKDNYNLARYEAKCAGDIVLIGQGAGRYPTASAVLRDLSDVIAGQRVMMPQACVRVTADCSGCGHPYYVRLPEAFAGKLPCDKVAVDNGIARVITKALTVKEMHDTAAALRTRGAQVFFAGIEE